MEGELRYKIYWICGRKGGSELCCSGCELFCGGCELYCGGCVYNMERELKL